MSLLKIANRAYVNTATVGSGGTIILGAPVDGYQGFEGNPHIASGDTVVYGIEDGSNWEIGTADLVDNAGTFELQNRTPSESSAGGGAITLSGDARVFGTVRQEDLSGGTDANYQETVFVDKNGSADSTGKNPVRPTTLANAVANAGQGDAILVHRGQYPSVTVNQRNVAIMGMAVAGASGQFPTIDAVNVTAGGIKLANMMLFGGLTIDTTDASGIGSHLSAVNTNGLTITGDQFLEGDDVKVYASGGNNTVIGGTAARYFYGSEFEAGITYSGSDLLYIQDSISGPITVTSGTVVLRDITATVANGALVIGPGVAYSLQGVGGFDVQIDPAAINITDANILGGMTEGEAQQASKVWFEGLRANAMELAGRLTTTEQAVADFAADGAVAASDLDRTTVLAFSQTTADVTLTLSAPTDNTPSRLLLLRNDGTADLTVEGETLEAGKFSFAYWDGSAWAVFSAASQASGGVQPVVETQASASGTTTLDADIYNWFNVTPTGDVDLAFSLTSQDEAKFDLVWTNASVQTGYDLANASYDNVSKDVSFEIDNPHGIAFSADGTVMLVASNSDEEIQQYNLSTAYDVSTASSGVSYDVSAQVSSLSDVALSPDGLTMFVSGLNVVAQYNLTTANDLSGGVTHASTQSVVSEDASPEGISFSPDGTRMFMAGATNKRIYSYTLSTAFDLSTISFDSASLDVSGETPGLQGVDISSDGTKLFTVGLSNDIVAQYDLTTPFNVSTGSYSGTSFSVVSQDNIPRGLRFSADGTKMYVAGGNVFEVYQYTAALPPVAANLTFPASVVWDGGSAPTLSADGEEDWLRFDTTDGGATWFGYIERQNGVRPTAGPVSTGGVQPTVETIGAASGSTSLDLDSYNWFNVKPVDDVELAFDLSAQDEGKFDLVWENDEKTFVNAAPLSVGYRTELAEFEETINLPSLYDNPVSLAFSNNGSKAFILNGTNNTVYEFSLSNPFILGSFTATGASLFVGAQNNGAEGIEFNNDGTKMFMTGDSPATVQQYVLSTPFDLSTASYDNKSFNVSSQETNPNAVRFNNDGTKMYVAGYQTDRIHQYTLANPFDVSSATFELSGTSYGGFESTLRDFHFNQDGTKVFFQGASNGFIHQRVLTTPFDVSTGGAIPFDAYDTGVSSIGFGFAFNADGTKMYVIDSGNDRVRQYTTGVTSGIDSASYDAVSFEVASQTTAPNGMSFNNDGTKMYIVGSISDNVYQYTLSTAFDISTASYDSVSFNVGSQAPVPQDVMFNSSGTKMYIVGSTSDSVHQYTLSTAFDISTASYDSVSLNINAQDASPQGLTFNNDGTKMYIISSVSDSVYQYTLSTAFDLSTASYDNVSFNASDQDTGCAGFTFNSNGTKAFVLGFSRDRVYQYSLGTAFDLSTASYDYLNVRVGAQASTPKCVRFNNDYTKMYILNGSTDTVYQYSVGTIQADIHLAEYLGEFIAVGSQDTAPASLEFNADGTKMFVIGYNSDSIHQYSLTLPYDLSTASYDNIALSLSSQMSTPMDFQFNNDGTKMYVMDASADNLHQYSLSTPYSITSASYDNVTFSHGSQESSDGGFAISPDGTRLFLTGLSSDRIWEYRFTSPFDLSTLEYTGSSFGVTTQTSAPCDVLFTSSGKKMFLLDAQNDLIHQFSLTIPFRLSSMQRSLLTLDVSRQFSSPYGFTLSGDETKLFVVGISQDRVREYTLPGETTVVQKIELDLPAEVVWEGGNTPALSDSGNKDWFRFETANGGSKWFGKVIDQGF